MKRERKIYDPAFKTKAVQLNNERTNISELARELGIAVTLIYKWRKEYEEFGEGSFPGNGNLKLTPEQEKNPRIGEKAQGCRIRTRYIKKSNRHLLQGRSMKYKFIQNNECIFPIEKMCNDLKLSSSGYYKWKSRPFSKKLLLKEKIKEQITSIYFSSKQRYGSPRITFELNSLGYKISRITVVKYMKELDLRSKLSKKFKVTTNSKHKLFGGRKCVGQEFYCRETYASLGF